MIKDLKELYAYRQMIFSLVKKDLRGRYTEPLYLPRKRTV